MFKLKHTYNYIAFGNMDNAGGTRREDNTPRRSFWCQNTRRQDYDDVQQKLNEKIETENAPEKAEQPKEKNAANRTIGRIGFIKII